MSQQNCPDPAAFERAQYLRGVSSARVRDASTENSGGICTVTRGKLRERAIELAVIDGRSTQDVSKSDWEQAKRELTGEPDMEARTQKQED